MGQIDDIELIDLLNNLRFDEGSNFKSTQVKSALSDKLMYRNDVRFQRQLCKETIRFHHEICEMYKRKSAQNACNIKNI